MTGDLYSLALSVPWCITGEALEAILSIAARDPLPTDEIARRMHGPKSLALRQGQRRDDAGRMTMHGSVALIPIDGPIYRYADFFTHLSGGVTTEQLGLDLQTALDDPAVGGIALIVDSPGGEATAINELSDTIYAARSQKPIVAYIEGYGASAAYWIASAASTVLVDDNALVGSIGTVLGVPDPTKRPTNRIDIVSTQSPKKRPDVMTAEGRAVLQQLADDMTEVFIAKVMRNRDLTREQVLAIEGGLLVGEHAIVAGLADALGSEDGAIRMLTSGALTERGLSPLRKAYPLIAARLTAQRPQQEVSPMGDSKGFWAGFWGGAKEAGIVPEAAAEQPTSGTRLVAVTAEQLATMEAAAAPLQPVQQTSQQDAEIADLRKQLAQARAERIQADAQAFVKEQLGVGRAFPAEQAAIAALYIRAAEIDATAPREDGQPSCVALVKAAYADRPASSMARSMVVADIKQPKATVLANTGSQEDADIAQAEASARKYGEQRNGKKSA